MGSTKLNEDLSNCIINFDRRVLITDLLDEYKLAYKEVNDAVVKFVEQQEKKEKLKFDKKYLVHGLKEGNQKTEVYKIVEEAKLKEWINKLKNVESALYSVEVAGGAKSGAPVFKPMSVQEDVKIKVRHVSKTSATNGVTTSTKNSAPVEKKEDKPKVIPITKPQESPKKSLVKVESSAKKTSPKNETSPKDKKTVDKKSANKNSINNFFAPASSKKAEDKETKSSSAIVKPPTPKKMEDFFKKQTEKPKTTTESLKKPAANTSVQLFDDDEEEEPEEVSSDEEEKLEALKRDIISSDVEMDGDEEAEAKPTTSKRRRIIDSEDEEDDPPVKHEKLDVKKEIEEKEPEAETYLDEDGFVITKKPKQKSSTSSSKSPTTKKTPPVTIKTSPKESKKSASTSSKATANPGAKTKQAGIMNFFSKK